MAYFIAFVLAAAVPMAALLSMNSRVGNVWGDLTRLGRLSTHDFGRNAPPDAPPLQLHHADENAARVVVLGDSFSAWNQWQSQWMTWRQHKDVVSFHWDAIGGGACLAEWVLNLQARMPGARRLVVEVIERSFAEKLAALDKPCTVPPAGTQPLQTVDSVLADERPESHWPPPDPHHVLRALAAHYKTFDRQSRRDEVVVTPLNRSDLFTSRRSHLLLRYLGDSGKLLWRAPSLQAGAHRLKALQDELAAQGITMTMVIVPDKSTLYAPYFRHPEDRVLAAADPWQLLQDAGVRQVPLLDRLRQALPFQRDIYLPDDTHFSIDGYRLMAAAVRDVVDH